MTAKRSFYARMRVTYFEEWIVSAETKEEAEAKIKDCETDDTIELECVDWELVGPVKSNEDDT